MDFLGLLTAGSLEEFSEGLAGMFSNFNFENAISISPKVNSFGKSHVLEAAELEMQIAAPKTGFATYILGSATLILQIKEIKMLNPVNGLTLFFLLLHLISFFYFYKLRFTPQKNIFLQNRLLIDSLIIMNQIAIWCLIPHSCGLNGIAFELFLTLIPGP